MDSEKFSRVFNSENWDIDASTFFPALMRKVYLWMTLALVITALTAYLAGPLLFQLGGGGFTFLIAGAIEIGIVAYLSARINKLSLVQATVGFIIYAILNGVTLGWIFAVYPITSIFKTFVITAAMFGTMAIIGSVTKKDLSKMGGIASMGLIGLIIAAVVNLFLRSTMIDFIVSGIGVVVFTGMTAWDVQHIKESMARSGGAPGEQVQKQALMGALRLYLDFINLFISLLRFFGRLRESQYLHIHNSRIRNIHLYIERTPRFVLYVFNSFSICLKSRRRAKFCPNELINIPLPP